MLPLLAATGTAPLVVEFAGRSRRRYARLSQSAATPSSAASLVQPDDACVLDAADAVEALEGEAQVVHPRVAHPAVGALAVRGELLAAKKLAALGYVRSRQAAAGPGAGDPKRMIRLYARTEKALQLALGGNVRIPLISQYSSVTKAMPDLQIRDDQLSGRLHGLGHVRERRSDPLQRLVEGSGWRKCHLMKV